MQIKTIHIDGFGKFVQRDFDVVAGWQVFAGENEAGKSTLRAFIKGVLFGFPSGKGAVNTYEPKEKGVTYGGNLTVEIDGVTYTIARHQRTSSTLTVIADGGLEMPDPESWLQQQLGQVTSATFDAIYYFNQQDLTRIVGLSGEELQRTLFSVGAVDANAWLDAQKALQKQADSLFSAKSRTKPLNKALSALSADEAALQNAQAQLAQTRDVQENLVEKQADLAREKNTLTHLQTDLLQAQQLAQLVPVYERAQVLSEQVDTQRQSLAAVVPVTADDVQNLQVQAREITELTKRVDALNGEQASVNQMDLQQWTGRAANLRAQVDYDLRAQADAVSAQGDVVADLQAEYQQAAQLPAFKAGWLVAGVGLLIGLAGIFWRWPLILLGLVVMAAGIWWQMQRQQQAPARDLGARLTQAEQQLASLTQALQAKQTVVAREISTLAQTFALPVTQTEWFAQQKTVLADFEQLAAQAQRQQSQQQERTQLITRLQAVQTQFQSDLTRLQATEIGQLTTRLQQQNQLQTAAAQLDLLQAQLGDSATQVAAFDGEKLANLTTAVQAKQAQVQDLQQTVANLSAQAQQMVTDETTVTLAQQIADEQTAILADLQQYLTQNLAAKTIEQTLTLATQGRFPQMQAQAQTNFARLTNGRYTEILLADKQLQVVRDDAQRFNVTELSTGTQEQLYVALRLAFVAVMADLVNLPVMIDDSFVNFDGVRQQAMFTLLAELAQRQQILYWTANVDFEDTRATVTRLEA